MSKVEFISAGAAQSQASDFDVTKLETISDLNLSTFARFFSSIIDHSVSGDEGVDMHASGVDEMGDKFDYTCKVSFTEANRSPLTKAAVSMVKAIVSEAARREQGDTNIIPMLTVMVCTQIDSSTLDYMASEQRKAQPVEPVWVKLAS